MISGGGRGSVLVEIDTHVGAVCAPVGEIDQREGDFDLNGQYQSYSLVTPRIHKQLAVKVEGVYWLRSISTLGWCVWPGWRD